MSEQEKISQLRFETNKAIRQNELFIPGSGSNAVGAIVLALLAVAEQLAIFNDRKGP